MEERKKGRKLVNSVVVSTERYDLRKLQSDISHLSNLYLSITLIARFKDIGTLV